MKKIIYKEILLFKNFLYSKSKQKHLVLQNILIRDFQISDIASFFGI